MPWRLLLLPGTDASAVLSSGCFREAHEQVGQGPASFVPFQTSALVQILECPHLLGSLV